MGDTPLTLRKISREVDYSNKKVQEAISALSSNNEQPPEIVIERKRKISRQESGETRKDSFSSNFSRQELMDILDEDEAAWDQKETIAEETLTKEENNDSNQAENDTIVV